MPAAMDFIRCFNCHDFVLHTITFNSETGNQIFRCLICKIEREYAQIDKKNNSIIRKDQLESIRENRGKR